MRMTAVVVMIAALAACDDGDDGGGSAEEMSAFALQFEAIADGAAVGCTDTIAGLGPDGAYSAGLSDLRFYVSNVRFEDAEGQPVEFTLDSDDFQYVGDDGAVALIDLTGNTDGTCGANAIAFAEGTARTNAALRGMTFKSRVARVSFDVGVPQPLMQSIIGSTTEEAAPTPLNEMYWNWASGYRHFVLNFAVTRDDGETGEGYLHVGSRDCGPMGEKALSDRDACGNVNTPKVSLDGFSLDDNVVQVDLNAIFADLDFITEVYDQETFEVIGEGPGAGCHSSPMQSDCTALFGALGLDLQSGAATAAGNGAFGMR